MRLRLAAGIAAATLCATACSRPGSDDRAFEWREQLPPGAVVHIRDGAGDIAVRRAPGQTAVVTGLRRWQRGRSRDIRFVVTQMGNDYYICAMWRASGKCGTGNYRGRQTGTFLTMFSLFHRNSDASADFVAEIPSNVVVDAKTTTGSVQVDGITAGVTAHTTSGAVEASNVSGPLSLATTTGNVRLVTDSLTSSDDIRLSTTRGDIRAELPPNVQGKFDLSVLKGAVRSDLDLPPASESRAGRHFQGQIGTSSRVVKMRAMNGVVTVLTRPAPTSH